MTDSDEELVALVLGGSQKAAAELFRRHWVPSWRAAFAVVGRRALADDVAQDAFQRAFGALATFDLSMRFAPWLHRIVVNRALDVVRAERRLVELADEPTEELREENLPDSELLAAVARLDADRRVVVGLRYWLDYSPAEIAELLELPVGTVSSRLSRALVDLRVDLEGSRV